MCVCVWFVWFAWGWCAFLGRTCILLFVFSGRVGFCCLFVCFCFGFYFVFVLLLLFVVVVVGWRGRRAPTFITLRKSLSYPRKRLLLDNDFILFDHSIPPLFSLLCEYDRPAICLALTHLPEAEGGEIMHAMDKGCGVVGVVGNWSGVEVFVLGEGSVSNN